MNEFQERLHELLIESNLSRLQLANFLGISSTTINGYFNKNYYPQIDIAFKMADYFDCSLDYLFGLSDVVENNNSNTKCFFDNFEFLINENRLPIARALREMHMGEYNYYRWKQGKFPKTNNLIEIAKYFEVGMDYLVGRVAQK